MAKCRSASWLIQFGFGATLVSGSARLANAWSSEDCILRKHALWTELERRVMLAEEAHPLAEDSELLARAASRFYQSGTLCLKDVAAAMNVLDDVAKLLPQLEALAR